MEKDPSIPPLVSEPQRSSLHPGVILRRLYQWVIHWAQTPHAKTALVLIAFAESSFFPIPPDVLLIAMGVSAPHGAIGYAGLMPGRIGVRRNGGICHWVGTLEHGLGMVLCLYPWIYSGSISKSFHSL